MHAGRRDFDIFAIANQSTKKTFGNWAAANVTGTNKEDAFHD